MRLSVAAVLLLLGCGKVVVPKSPVVASEKPVQQEEAEESLEAKGTYEGRLSNRDIQPVFSAREESARACYQAGKRKNSQLAGEVVVRFEISPKGRPRNVWVERATLGDSEVEQCLKTLVSSMEFPTPEGGSVLASYPLRFAPSAVTAGVGSPTEKERAAFSMTVKKAISSCTLPEEYTAALWVDGEGKVLSAGYGSPKGEEAHACVVSGLLGANFPKNARRLTHVVWPEEEAGE